jgi:hypothetical protein
VRRLSPFAVLAAVAACASGQPADQATDNTVDAMDAAASWAVCDRVRYEVDVADAGRHRAFFVTLETIGFPPLTESGLPPAWDPTDRGTLTTTTPQFEPGPLAMPWCTGPARMRVELRGAGRCQQDLVEQEGLAHVRQPDVCSGRLDGVEALFSALRRCGWLAAGLQELAHDSFHEMRLTWPDRKPPPVAELQTPFGVQPTCQVPFTLMAGDEPVLHGRIQFTWKRAPLLPSAGVLQVEAWRAQEPARRLAIRLVSAHRGPATSAPDPFDLGQGLRVGMTAGEVSVRNGTFRRISRGRIGDGRGVDLIEFGAGSAVLLGIFSEDRLLYASAHPEAPGTWLWQRGFAPEEVTTCGPDQGPWRR